MDTPLKQNVDENSSRGHWGSRAEFLLSCVGFSVGLGNVWRFPFLAYENGGGAFLVPYVTLLLLVGKPLYFMEAALGQFGQCGPLSVFREMLPCALGVGVAMVLVSLIVAIYYNVIMAYCLAYLFHSFQAVLPWSVCDPAWGADEYCYVRGGNSSVGLLHGSCQARKGIAECGERQPQTSEEQFWEKAVLDLKQGGIQDFGDLGSVKMDLLFYLALSWLVVLLCLSKGIKSSGKVVYFTATFPYVVLLALLVLGVSLPGAELGLEYLFIPKWEKLSDLQVWRKAAGQVFFSLGISWGGIVLFGSYNKFNAAVHIDAHIVSIVDFITSLIASVVIFSTLGHSAKELGVPVETVAKGGQGLAFVAYPEALSNLPGAHFWSVIFFIMLFLLGLDSEFALFETVVSSLYDVFPSLLAHKGTVTSVLCLFSFLLGIPCVTQGGQYVLNLMDTYGASLSVLAIAVAEVTAIMWGYGANNYGKDLQAMLGFYPGLYFRVCWVVVSPVLLTCILILGVISWEAPTYGGVSYPQWAHYLGWSLTLVSVIQIPLWFFISALAFLVRGHGFKFLRPAQTWLDRRRGGNPENLVSSLSYFANQQPSPPVVKVTKPPEYASVFTATPSTVQLIKKNEIGFHKVRFS